MRILVRLLGFLLPYWPRVILATVLGLITVVSNIALLGVASYLVAAAALKPYLALLSFPMYLVQVASVTRAFSRYAERLQSHDVTLSLLASLRTWFYTRLVPLSPNRLRAFRGGDLLARIVADIDDLDNVFQRVLSPAIVAGLTTALVGIVLGAFSPLLGLTAVGALVITGAGVPALIGALSRGLGRRELEVRASLHVAIVDGVHGLQDLLAAGRAEDHQTHIARLNKQLRQVQQRVAVLDALQTSLTDLLLNGAMWMVLLLAIPLVVRGHFSGVYLAVLALIVLSAGEAIHPLGHALAFLGRSLTAGERLFEVVDMQPAVVDPPRPMALPTSVDLEFDRVSFAYDADEPPVLSDISFTLRSGNHVAIVGPSGAGKSSLVNLAVRFYDPTSGVVKLGGLPIMSLAQDDLRRSVGVVAQDTHVFNTTLRANLLLAKPDATEIELHRALSQAQLTNVVSRLPDGLDSFVGEQGQALAGGERQRLAIARALLKNAPLLLLDEPTANLDPLTERRLLAAIYMLMEERTTLLISHRLVGMESMDEILVLDKGRIVQRGTHEALVNQDGLYRRMFEVQNEMLLVGT